MRKVLFLIMAVLLAACSTTPEQRAQRLVTDYIKSTANDPSSVQDVEVSFVQLKKEMDIKGNWIKRHYTVVEWREKNVYGALVNQSVVVKFDEDVTEIICFNCFGS
jgi:uncharacterized lipoprotein YmbA